MLFLSFFCYFRIVDAHNLTGVTFSARCFETTPYWTSFNFLCSFVGGTVMPEPQIGLEEQSSVHPRPVARYLPASPHYPVPIRRQDGNARRQRVLPCFYGELDQEDQTDHKSVQRWQRANVRGELSAQVRPICKYSVRRWKRSWCLWLRKLWIFRMMVSYVTKYGVNILHLTKVWKQTSENSGPLCADFTELVNSFLFVFLDCLAT